MKLYYIFKINNNYKKLTKDQPYNLFMILNGIKNSDIKDINSAYSLFKSVSLPINKKEIKNFIKEIRGDDFFQEYDDILSYNNYYSQEISKLFIHNSFLILKTNSDNSVFLNYLHKDDNLFIIDFKNKDYYWLNTMYIN